MSETQIDDNNIDNGLYPEVFKKIDSVDIQINPFQAFKTFTVLSCPKFNAGIVAEP